MRVFVTLVLWAFTVFAIAAGSSGLALFAAGHQPIRRNIDANLAAIILLCGLSLQALLILAILTHSSR